MIVLALFVAGLCRDAADDVFLREFDGYESCLIVRRIGGSKERAFNFERGNERFSPCNTFKIPHAVFALHYGVAAPDEVFVWDGTPSSRKVTERDHTLASAIEFSVVPVFREIAGRIGAERMNDALKALQYGDMDITGGLDRFWLTSSLKISAREQVDLIGGLIDLEWPFARSAQRWVKAHLLVDEGPGYRIFGKTGSGIIGEDRWIGWWVGWVETGSDTWIFAGNYEGSDALGDRMRPKVDAVLRAMGVLPAT